MKREPKQFTPLLLAVFISFFSFGQNTLLSDSPFIGMPSRPAIISEVEALNALPSHIQFIAGSLLDSSMTEFTDKVVFMSGQILDLEKTLKEDPAFPLNYHEPLPKYELFFELRDSSIGIKTYEISLDLDEYGQVLAFNWPRINFSKHSDFLKVGDLKKTAEKYAKKKKYKTKEFICTLVFDDHAESLRWNFAFLQESSGTQRSFYKSYNVIVVDPQSGEVTGELGMASSGIACGNL